jgi:hypothetical protein
MLATIAGLIVAIPSVFGYNLLLGQHAPDGDRDRELRQLHGRPDRAREQVTAPMARNFRRPHATQPIADLNVTNLIDLGFMLLIIFMVATPLINQQEQTTRVNLPAIAKVPQQKPDKDERFVADQRRRRRQIFRREQLHAGHPHGAALPLLPQLRPGAQAAGDPRARRRQGPRREGRGDLRRGGAAGLTRFTIDSQAR